MPPSAVCMDSSRRMAHNIDDSNRTHYRPMTDTDAARWVDAVAKLSTEQLSHERFLIGDRKSKCVGELGRLPVSGGVLRKAELRQQIEEYQAKVQFLTERIDERKRDVNNTIAAHVARIEQLEAQNKELNNKVSETQRPIPLDVSAANATLTVASQLIQRVRQDAALSRIHPLEVDELDVAVGQLSKIMTMLRERCAPIQWLQELYATNLGFEYKN